jgi:Tol biopolymer transport system component
VPRLALAVAVALLAAGCGGVSEGSGAAGELVVSLEDRVVGLDLESGEERDVGPAAMYGGAWSPSGTRVATGDWSTTLVTEVATGVTERFDTPQCGSHGWSPDETLLACEYSDPWTVSTFDHESGEVSRLTDPKISSGEPAWSPDSRSLAYVELGAVMIMSRDGSGKRRVADAGSIGSGLGPAWSPDGLLIAYLSGNNVWVVSPEGRDRRMLLDDGRATRGLAWSPDGRYLALARGDGDFEIFVVDVATGEARKLTDNERVNDQWPTWSPDSRHIAYLSDGEDGPGVHVVPVDGGEPTRVIELGGEGDDGAGIRASRLARILHWLPRAPG